MKKSEIIKSIEATGSRDQLKTFLDELDASIGTDETIFTPAEWLEIEAAIRRREAETRPAGVH